MASIGHNTQSHDLLRQFIERIERLEAQKGEIAEDIKQVYVEARSQGYDVKTLRQVIKIRKKSRADHINESEMLNAYLAALGMIEEIRS